MVFDAAQAGTLGEGNPAHLALPQMVQFITEKKSWIASGGTAGGPTTNPYNPAYINQDKFFTRLSGESIAVRSPATHLIDCEGRIGPNPCTGSSQGSPTPCPAECTSNGACNGLTCIDGNLFACPTSLVGYWPMDGNWNDAFDNNPGTAQGDATFGSNGQLGQAGSFDGVGDFTDLGTSNDLTPNNVMSAGVWFKTSSIAAHDILGKGSCVHPSGQSFTVALVSGIPRFFVNIPSIGGSGDRTLIGAGPSLADGNWHYMVATYDGATQKLYIDGALNASQATSGAISNSTNSMVIGGKFSAHHCGGGVDFNGLIDDAAIYDEALSPEQILANYNRGLAGAGACAGPESPSDCAAGVDGNHVLSLVVPGFA